MDQVYLTMWELAQPYYKKGRSYDIEQVAWMMKQADRLTDLEGLNKKILLPLVILHDVGYSKVEIKDPNIKDKVTKKIHMREGARIAKEILNKVGYDQALTEKIVYYISVHDNWILDDNSPYQESSEMALFNDLDFLWVTSNIDAFKVNAKSLNMTPEEFYKFWEKDEKITSRPFCCETTKRMFDKSMEKIKTAISQGSS